MKLSIAALGVATMLVACEARASSPVPRAQAEEPAYALTVKIDDV